jgi:hypothetical protein
MQASIRVAKDETIESTRPFDRHSAAGTLALGQLAKDRRELQKLVRGGVQPVRVVPRALALLQLDKGVSAPCISAMVPLTPQAIRKVGHRYQDGGLERALYERQRPGAAEVLDDNQKQRLIAMVCSNPREGRARWTVRLVAEEAVKRKLVPRVGREPSAFSCSATTSNRGGKKLWVCAGINRHGVEDERASRERSSEVKLQRFCKKPRVMLDLSTFR